MNDNADGDYNPSAEELAALEAELLDLERTDPDVAAASRRLDDAVERIIHPTTSRRPRLQVTLFGATAAYLRRQMELGRSAASCIDTAVLLLQTLDGVTVSDALTAYAERTGQHGDEPVKWFDLIAAVRGATFRVMTHE